MKSVCSSIGIAGLALVCLTAMASPGGGHGGGGWGGGHGGGGHGGYAGHGGGYAGHGGGWGGHGGGWGHHGWGGWYGGAYVGFYDPFVPWFDDPYGYGYPAVQLVDPAAATPPSQVFYRYYCPSTNAYYPDVPTCAAPWLRVVPQN